MKPVKQTKFGEEGNCLWACVASILEVNIEDLPDTKCTDINDEELWLKDFYALNDFLKDKYGIFICAINNSEYIEKYVKDTFVIGVGISKSSGCNHAVVMKNGEVKHDPKGAYDVETIEEYEIFVKCFA